MRDPTYKGTERALKSYERLVRFYGDYTRIRLARIRLKPDHSDIILPETFQLVIFWNFQVQAAKQNSTDFVLLYAWPHAPRPLGAVDESKLEEKSNLSRLLTKSKSGVTTWHHSWCCFTPPASPPPPNAAALLSVAPTMSD